MKNREKYEDAIFTIRFYGTEFKTHGVSIYDLSQSLLAVQRILHKAYLVEKNRLVKGAFPHWDERPALALQIGERRRESDAFALVPLLSDPQVRTYIMELAKYVIAGVVSYYVGDVLDSIRKEKNKNIKMFIGSIYTEVANIVNRIDASGGVEGISIGSPALERDTFAAFNSDTKYYLRTLKDEYFLGDYQEIKGRVYKLYPASKIVAIRGEDERAVSIFLTDDDFDKIRYHRETKPFFLFKGRARYPLGVETETVYQFEADEIQHIDE